MVFTINFYILIGVTRDIFWRLLSVIISSALKTIPYVHVYMQTEVYIIRNPDIWIIMFFICISIQDNSIHRPGFSLLLPHIL